MLISQQNKQLAPTAGDDASQSTTSTKTVIQPAANQVTLLYKNTTIKVPTKPSNLG